MFQLNISDEHSDIINGGKDFLIVYFIQSGHYMKVIFTCLNYIIHLALKKLGSNDNDDDDDDDDDEEDDDDDDNVIDEGIGFDVEEQGEYPTDLIFCGAHKKF